MRNIVVAKEEPQKEEQRISNINKLFENKMKTEATEKEILHLISSSKGDDLLRDEALVNAL